MRVNKFLIFFLYLAQAVVLGGFMGLIVMLLATVMGYSCVIQLVWFATLIAGITSLIDTILTVQAEREMR